MWSTVATRSYNFPLGKLARQMKYQQCSEKRVRVRAVMPGER